MNYHLPDSRYLTDGSSDRWQLVFRELEFQANILLFEKNFVSLQRPNLSLWADGDNYIAEKATLYALFLAI